VHKLLADPTGVGYFGRPLWQVADADVLRYQICVAAARDVLGRASSTGG